MDLKPTAGATYARQTHVSVTGWPDVYFLLVYRDAMAVQRERRVMFGVWPLETTALVGLRLERDGPLLGLDALEDKGVEVTVGRRGV